MEEFFPEQEAKLWWMYRKGGQLYEEGRCVRTGRQWYERNGEREDNYKKFTAEGRGLGKECEVKWLNRNRL